jgi:Cys-tRNA synthase (O-phospho-L-seryl-tRNA:Cys-tRNA synthase)
LTYLTRTLILAPQIRHCFESVSGPFGVLGVSEAWSDKPIKCSEYFLQDKNREGLWISRHGGAFVFGAAAAFFRE